jgi:hypothetical protein
LATGVTTTTSLADSLETVLDAGRTVREHDGVVAGTADKRSLPPNTGLSWGETTTQQLEAQSVSETGTLNNPQEIADTLFSITPTMVGIFTIITDRVKQRIFRGTLAEIGMLSQNAVNRKKDLDGITAIDGATTSLVGAGNPLTSGHISAATSRIMGNTVEPGSGTIYTVLHPFQTKDLRDEVVKVGTYPIPTGLSERVYQKGYTGIMVDGAVVLQDGNIPIDTSDDAKGGVYTSEALVLVQGRGPRSEPERFPRIGGGADGIVYYDEYAYGERSAGNWLFEIYSDATVPTS